MFIKKSGAYYYYLEAFYSDSLGLPLKREAEVLRKKSFSIIGIYGGGEEDRL